MFTLWMFFVWNKFHPILDDFYHQLMDAFCDPRYDEGPKVVMEVEETSMVALGYPIPECDHSSLRV